MSDCLAACPGYVDADGDGVCDNYASGQGAGRGAASCPGYVDADADGACDNDGSGCGRARGMGHHGGQGYGCRR